ncbi:E3 ubiquitin- ligase DTX3L [Paramuricea clavata]|uniref:E3 ubiquitin-protein ligase n=1 Tax=Paramuricea clavata TaxID=317549 RepID=A0A7D9DAD6_PARCT|nr:E3 ubiquitin- ligase DTX3L [Paramuricea clavata]
MDGKGNRANPSDQSAQTKEPDESFSVSSLFLRFIIAYHYEEYQKLENVSQEISFEVSESKTDRKLKLFARKNVSRDTFSKTVDEFISFYHNQNQKMHQEVISMLPKKKNCVILEARAKFSVVIDSAQDPDKVTIYGERDNVEEAKRFLRSGAENEKGSLSLKYSPMIKIQPQEVDKDAGTTETSSSKGAKEVSSSEGTTETSSSKGAKEASSSKATTESSSSKGASEANSSKGTTETSSSKGTKEASTSKGTITGASSSKGVKEASFCKDAPDTISSKGATETNSSKGTTEANNSKGAPEVSSSKGTTQASSSKGAPETSSSEYIEKLPKDKKDVLSQAPTNGSSKEATAKVALTEKFSSDLSENLKLVVYQGDLTKETVDAIVNPANDHLQHGSGAAGAILKAGGKSIQDESDYIMRKRGKRPLQPGEVELTAGGRLPCKFVVHAVGPVWNHHPPYTAMQLLYNAVINSLSLACHNGARSVSIPAISSGLYQVPVDVCARVLFDAVVYFASKANKSSPLEEIHFVNTESSTNRTFVQEMENRFRGSIKRDKVEASVSKDTKEQEREMQIGRQMAFTTTKSENNSEWGQTKNANFKGSSHNLHSGENKDIGGRLSDDKRSLLSYAGAATGKKPDTDHSPKPGADEKTSKDDECSICLSEIAKKKSLDKCGHSFCTKCINKAFKVKKQCPICYMVYGPFTGNQPKGIMYDAYLSIPLPGFNCSGSLVISYRFPNGTQGADHPNPGKPYQGTSRTAYLPNNQEGKKVLNLLKKAFNQKLTFTIGRSTTTGRDDCVIWNDIRHKTSIYGGPTDFGYPDPDYLGRVQDELAAKGITE